ncbi:VOC family protein [Streptomyces sp. NPDC059459]|uniref:VOC family protein n=1 Tax=unclassified Streptomyces TaxID=2593676 RepID=UPI003683DADC
MPDLLGINHLTLSTTDLDRLLPYYTELLGGVLAFERAATGSDPRIAVVDVGGNDHLMIVETPSAPGTEPGPLGGAGWGLRVERARDWRRCAHASCAPGSRSEDRDPAHAADHDGA